MTSSRYDDPFIGMDRPQPPANDQQDDEPRYGPDSTWEEPCYHQRWWTRSTTLPGEGNVEQCPDCNKVLWTEASEGNAGPLMLPETTVRDYRWETALLSVVRAIEAAHEANPTVDNERRKALDALHTQASTVLETLWRTEMHFAGGVPDLILPSLATPADANLMAEPAPGPKAEPETQETAAEFEERARLALDPPQGEPL